NDAQAFKCRLRQESATNCSCSYRTHSEEQKIAARPMVPKLGSHLHHLRRPFLKETFRLSWGHGFSRGLVVRSLRIVFVFKIHCQKSSDLSALVDQPTIMLRSVSHPSAKTRTTWGTTKRIKTHISQKCQMRALS